MPGAMFATVQGSMELAEFAPVQRRRTGEKYRGVQQGSTTTGEPRTGGSTEEWMSTRQACNPSSGPTPPPSLFLQFIFPIFPGNCFSLHTHINSSSIPTNYTKLQRQIFHKVLSCTSSNVHNVSKF